MTAGSAKEPIRIWVPGCATGEEVYSVAITLLEYFGDGPAPLRIQIFGTDVSEAALEKARAGVYPVNALHEVSTERRERFFAGQNGEYRISKDIRDLCLFARQDVTRDPPFSRLDLISCRNLLIYLDDGRATPDPPNVPLCASSAGHLFFGSAESVAYSPELFEQIESRSRVFRRLPNIVCSWRVLRRRVCSSTRPSPFGMALYALHGTRGATQRIRR